VAYTRTPLPSRSRPQAGSKKGSVLEALASSSGRRSAKRRSFMTGCSGFRDNSGQMIRAPKCRHCASVERRVHHSRRIRSTAGQPPRRWNVCGECVNFSHSSGKLKDPGQSSFITSARISGGFEVTYERHIDTHLFIIIFMRFFRFGNSFDGRYVGPCGSFGERWA